MIQSFHAAHSLLIFMDSTVLPKAHLDILQYLYRFRFLTSHQLQQFLNHKTIRLTNYHLKNLITHNYIGKHYSRSIGLANQPAVYYLSSGSIRILSTNPGFDKRALKRIYREKIRSQQFIAHASFIAEYFLYLQRDSEKTKHTLQFFTKTDLQLHPYLIHPLPDGYFARTDKKKEIKRYFLEVVEDSSPRFALRKRIEQYCDYIDDQKFEDATGHSFPTLLFICPSIASMIYLKKHIGRIYEETSLGLIEIYIATRENAFAGYWEKIETEE